MMRFKTVFVTAIVIGLIPSMAMAQAPQCAIPGAIPATSVIQPPPGEAYNIPITGYSLALSWSPQFCKTHDASKFDTQCKAERSFGFILHGLWPDGVGHKNPQWCKKVEAVPRDVVKQTWCATPSADLQQHEWAKHGSCMAKDASQYFRTARLLYDALKWPDMDALSRQTPLTVGMFRQAFVAANPGLKAETISVGLTQLGWLEEVRLCLGADLHTTRCARAAGGAGNKAKLRIWRSAR